MAAHDKLVLEEADEYEYAIDPTSDEYTTAEMGTFADALAAMSLYRPTFRWLPTWRPARLLELL